MYIHSLIVSFLAVAVSATAIPADDFGMSVRARSPLEKRDTYDCSGSSLCGSIPISACDNAVNNEIIRNNDVNYGAPG